MTHFLIIRRWRHIRAIGLKQDTIQWDIFHRISVFVGISKCDTSRKSDAQIRKLGQYDFAIFQAICKAVQMYRLVGRTVFLHNLNRIVLRLSRMNHQRHIQLLGDFNLFHKHLFLHILWRFVVMEIQTAFTHCHYFMVFALLSLALFFCLFLLFFFIVIIVVINIISIVFRIQLLHFIQNLGVCQIFGIRLPRTLRTKHTRFEVGVAA
mmetsp:Transcript_46481/g.74501  ORF Transcript_46481/g.74501 Transcript_46481/m.74501 type:complete len:208 (-) Transcript_46481:667-1290(-)